MFHTKILATAVGLSMAASAAAAKTVDFLFTDSLGPTSSYQQTVDGLTVTITAGSFIGGFSGSVTSVTDQGGNSVDGWALSGNSFDNDARVDPDSNGLGVINNFSAGTDNDDDVDGSGWDDFLILSFSQKVQVTSATFGAFGFNDDYRLFYDLNGNGSLGNGDFLTFTKDDNPLTNFPVVVGDLIGFAATGSNDEWKLKKISVAAVPLPAAGWMLLAGIGGLAAMRRRKKS